MPATSACPDAAPENEEWTEAQASAGVGLCDACDRHTTLRTDPFGAQSLCKKDWESVVYGED